MTGLLDFPLRHLSVKQHADKNVVPLAEQFGTFDVGYAWKPSGFGLLPHDESLSGFMPGPSPRSRCFTHLLLRAPCHPSVPEVSR